jgi:hypothetical protein
MDYASLAADIPVRLMASNRQWPQEIANTIRKGQERLLRTLHPDALRQPIEGNLELVDDLQTTSGTIDLTELGDQFGELVSLVLFSESGVRRPMLPRAYDYCCALFPASDRGMPKFYAEKTPGLFVVFPTPSRGYPWRGVANLRCPLIVAGGPATNLLTDRFATLLEYACCVEGALWMKDSPAVQIWQAAFDDRIGIENDNIRRRRRDESTVVQRSTENAASAP